MVKSMRREENKVDEDEVQIAILMKRVRCMNSLETENISFGENCNMALQGRHLKQHFIPFVYNKVMFHYRWFSSGINFYR